MNLAKLNVQELNKEEMVAIEGGWRLSIGTWVIYETGRGWFPG